MEIYGTELSLLNEKTFYAMTNILFKILNVLPLNHNYVMITTYQMI